MKVEVKHSHDQKKNEQAPGMHSKKIPPRRKLLSLQLLFWIQLGEMKTFLSLSYEIRKRTGTLNKKKIDN